MGEASWPADAVRHAANKTTREGYTAWRSWRTGATTSRGWVMLRRACPTLLWAWVGMMSAEAQAQINLFAPAADQTPGVAYRAPDGSFGVRLPASWAPKSWSRERATATFSLQGPGDAFMQIRRTTVAEGAQARQLAARGKEFRLSQLPHFVEVGRRDVVFNGVVGASIFGTFWFQGNAQYPRAVEEVYLVVGVEAFEFHFECFEPIAGALAAEVTRVYQSFLPHPPLAPPKPAAPPDDNEDPYANIPF